MINALARSSYYRRLLSLLLFERHWSRQIDHLDFRSGLGDSAWLLYGLSRSLKPVVAVEIGSARGKSACYIGIALKENGKGHLYAIDPHTSTNWNDTESVETYETMRKHLALLNLTDVVTIVRHHSGRAVHQVAKPIDLLFIDGDHSYDGVKADWRSFTPYMSRFGIVVFHDTIWDLNPGGKLHRGDMGVPQFVEELRRDGFPILTIDRDYGVSLVQPTVGGIALI